MSRIGQVHRAGVQQLCADHKNSGHTVKTLARLSKYVVQIQAYFLLYCNDPIDWLI